MPRLLEAFTKGSKLFNSAAWKRGDITVGMIVGLLMLAKDVVEVWKPSIGVFLTTDVINALAVIILAVVSPLIHVATSTQLGVEVSDHDKD